MNRAGLVTTLLVVAVLIGVGSAAYLVMRQPTFWYELGAVFVEKSLPKLINLLTKRNDPDTEKVMAQCVLRNGRWDNFAKKCVEAK